MKNTLSRKSIFVDALNFIPVATVKQLDDVVLPLKLYKNNLPFDVTGQTLSLRIRKSNNETEELSNSNGNTVFTIDASNVDIKLRNSIFNVPGTVFLELNIADTSGQMTTTSFVINVLKREVGDDVVQSTEQYDTFKKALKAVEELQLGGVSEDTIIAKIEQLFAENKVDLPSSDGAYSIKNIEGVEENIDISSYLQGYLALTNHKAALLIPEGTWKIKKLCVDNMDIEFYGVGEKSILLIDELEDGYHGIYSYQNSSIKFYNLKFKASAGVAFAKGDTGGCPVACRDGKGIGFYNCYFDNSLMPDTAWSFGHVKDLDFLDVINCSGEYAQGFIVGLGMTYRPTNITHVRALFNDFKVLGGNRTNKFIDLDNEPLGVDSNYIYSSALFAFNHMYSETLTAKSCMGIGYAKNYRLIGNVFENFTVCSDFDNPLYCECYGNIFRIISEDDWGEYALRVSTTQGQGGDYATYKELDTVNIHDNIIDGYKTPLLMGHGKNVHFHDNIVNRCQKAIYSYLSDHCKINRNKYYLVPPETGEKMIFDLEQDTFMEYDNNELRSYGDADITYGMCFKELGTMTDHRITNNYFDTNHITVTDWFIASEGGTHTNFVVENNHGINDVDPYEVFDGKYIYTGMKFNKGDFTYEAVSTTGGKMVQVDSSDNTLMAFSHTKEFYNVYTTHNLNCHYRTVYAHAAESAYNIYLTEKLLSYSGPMRIVLVDEPASTSSYVRVYCNFSGNIVNFDRDHGLRHAGDEINFYIKGGKIYGLDDISAGNNSGTDNVIQLSNKRVQKITANTSTTLVLPTVQSDRVVDIKVVFYWGYNGGNITLPSCSFDKDKPFPAELTYGNRYEIEFINYDGLWLAKYTEYAAI